MNKEMPDIHLIQERIANISIGASTLRNMGAKGMVKSARKYLEELDLTALRKVGESKFTHWLDDRTEELRKCFPEDAQHWGAARKAINVFLENALYDRFLSKEYGLDALEGVLEIPLDSQTAKGLKKDLEDPKGNRLTSHTLPEWDSIKRLKPEVSRKFQDCANEVAQAEQTSRIYLDLKYWRWDKNEVTCQGSCYSQRDFVITELPLAH